MDGVHDMGGRQGFGRVRYTLKAQTFHEPWEKRVNALYSLAVKLGIFNMDEYRHAIERMEPRHYLSASYYERSLTSLARPVAHSLLRSAIPSTHEARRVNESETKHRVRSRTLGGWLVLQQTHSHVAS